VVDPGGGVGGVSGGGVLGSEVVGEGEPPGGVGLAEGLLGDGLSGD
jgi:hypothetical protein